MAVGGSTLVMDRAERNAADPSPLKPLRILMLHNRYAAIGGEDISTELEARMLADRGHQVDTWQVSNEGIENESRVATAMAAIWSRDAVSELTRRLRSQTYDVVHVQNYFARLSPAVHQVARRHGVASVQHLRNYRFTCVNAMLFREGSLCLDCVGQRVPWKGVQRGCYRGSRSASMVVASMKGVHAALGTWNHAVTRYIAVSDYVKTIHVRAGLPADRISVRGNLVSPPSGERPTEDRGVFIASRLSDEKGIDTLIKAWRLRPRSETLEIAGVGPAETHLRAIAEGDETIRFLGHIPSAEVGRRMSSARLVVVSARWAEPFGRAAIEALAAGAPVLASNVGGLSEIFADAPQCLVPPDDAEALDARLTVLLTDARMRKENQEAGQRVYRNGFSRQKLAEDTEAIYRRAIAEARVGKLPR